MRQYATIGVSELAAPGISDTATELTVKAGHGPRFDPSPSGVAISPVDPLVLILMANAQDPQHEIVYVTAPRSGDTFPTVLRAQEGTAARAWGAGTIVQAGLTGVGMEEMPGTNFGISMMGMPYETSGGAVINGGLSADTAQFHRIRHVSPGLVSKIGLHVTAQSGDIAVGLARGPLGRANPTTIIATSGVVACPAVGYAEIALTAPVRVRVGDWFVIWASGTVAATYVHSGSGLITFAMGLGFYARTTIAGGPVIGAVPALVGSQNIVRPPMLMALP